MKANIGVSGKFKITVVRNNEVTCSTSFNNLVLNRFLTRWSEGSLSNTVQCLVGTGTVPPAETDTALTSAIGSPVTGTSLVETNYKIGTDYYASTKYTFTYSVGAIVNTISEIGVSFGSISGGLVDTKTLIKDLAGNPTSIELTALDQLIIEYYLIQKIPTTFAPSNILVNGTLISCEIETMGVLNSSAWSIWTGISDLYYNKLYAYNSEALHNNVETTKIIGSGLLISVTGITSQPVNSNTREIIFPIRFAQGNVAGGSINYLMFTKPITSIDTPTIGVRFTPGISKTTDISLTVKLQFSISRM